MRIAISGIFALVLLFAATSVQAQTQPCPLLGDTKHPSIGCDGIVNVLDYSFVTSVFGTSNPDADLKPDNIINILDHVILASNFGSQLPPSSTPTPTPAQTANIDPYLDAPECQHHDIEAWHGIWDHQQGCHYDHTHNSDPNSPEAIDIFGPYAAAWNQQELSYPWQTYAGFDGTLSTPPSPGQGMLENEAKHNGYKINFAVDDECDPGNFGYLDYQGCINAWRIQYHIVGGHGFNTRYHSAYVEARSCNGEDLNDCGILRFGGVFDYQSCHVPYKQGVAQCADGPPISHVFGAEPYRSFPPVEDIDFHLQHSWPTSEVWSSDHHGIYGFNQLGSVTFRIFDAVGGTTPQDPSNITYACRDSDDIYSCWMNSTEHSFEAVLALVPYELAGPDGKVNWQGFTNRKGEIDPNCSQSSYECVPTEYSNLNPGWHLYQQDEDFVPTHLEDFDLCVENGNVVSCRPFEPGSTPPKQQTVGWIKYPN